MRMSKYFSNMEEVEAHVETLRPICETEHDFQLFRHLFGLLENQGVSERVEIDGKTVEVDKSMAPILQRLWACGYRTLACCSGLRCEHPNPEFFSPVGYIALAYDAQLHRSLLGLLPAPAIQVKEGECYLKPALSIHLNAPDDQTMCQLWGTVLDTLVKLAADTPSA